MSNFQSNTLKIQFSNHYNSDSVTRESKSQKHDTLTSLVYLLQPDYTSQAQSATNPRAQRLVSYSDLPNGLGADYKSIAWDSVYQFDDIIEPFANFNEIINEVAIEDENIDANLLSTETNLNDSGFHDSVMSFDSNSAHRTDLFADMGLWFNLPIFGERESRFVESSFNSSSARNLFSHNHNSNQPDNTDANAVTNYSNRTHLNTVPLNRDLAYLEDDEDSDDDIERQLQRLSDNIMEKDHVDVGERVKEDGLGHEATTTADESVLSFESNMMAANTTQKYFFSNIEDEARGGGTEYVGRKRNID